MRTTILLSLLFALLISAKGQDTIITRLPQSTVCAGDITIPIVVENFNNVASISLVFNYDSTFLKYDSYNNVNPVFGSGMFFVNATNQKFIISWFSLQPVSIGNGTLLDVNFKYLGHQNSILNWDTLTAGSCVYTNLDGLELNSLFISGEVHKLMQVPQILLPLHLSLNVSTDPIISWTGSNCAPKYTLQVSQDSTFQNIDYNVSAIFGTTYSMTNLPENTMFFCRVKGFNNLDTTNWSTITKFKTKGPDGIVDFYEAASFNLVSCFHDPNTNQIQINLVINKPVLLSLQTINISGIREVIQEGVMSTPGSIDLKVNTTNYMAGLYLLIIDGKSISTSCQITKKLIIIKK